MKRYILALMCCVAAGIMYADCTTINGSPVTISRWGSAYVAPANEMECWIVNLRQKGTVKIAYQIDLELINALDQVMVYELDVYNNEILTETCNLIIDETINESFQASILTELAKRIKDAEKEHADQDKKEEQTDTSATEIVTDLEKDKKG